MNKRISPIKASFTPTVAFLLCVWLSGITCLFSCGVVSASVVSSEETGISTLPSCHQKSAREAEETSKIQTKQDFSAMQCCPFIYFTGDKSSKVSAFETPTKAVRTNFNFTPKIETRKISFQPNYKSLPRNRSGTYLLNCIFRI